MRVGTYNPQPTTFGQLDNYSFELDQKVMLASPNVK
jgi:hypothetical protein